MSFMKKIFLLLMVSLLWVPLNAQKNVNSKIEKVTVFLKGAQINRKASTSLKKGRTKVVFSNLSRMLDPNSIQVKGKGNFTIMSVQYQVNFLKQTKLDKRMKEMRDSVEFLQSKKDLNQQYYNALNQEQQMLIANQKIGGSNTGVNVTDLKALADYYRNRLKDIYTKMYHINKENGEISKEINKLNLQMQQSRANYQTRVGEIVVDLDVKETTQARFNITYLVSNAGWNPQYDIRAKDVNHPVQLHYRAIIHQSTGVEWKNVKLTVSTGNPNRNSVIPIMGPWYLNYYLNNPSMMRGSKGMAYENDIELDEDGVTNAEPQTTYTPIQANSKALQGANNSSNYTTVNVAQTAVLFNISIPYTIPSASKVVNVKIQKKELAADYRYYCVPKLSLDAYLQARITGWEELNLLPGSVNIFFDGTFVGKSYLNPSNISDTLDISLGHDASIIVKRNKIKDKTAKVVIGSTKKVNVGWEISVRNTKAKTINITILDQIPLSRSKDVEVILNNKDHAKYNENNGFLSWDLKIPSKKTVKKGFNYTVKYPKKYIVPNQW